MAGSDLKSLEGDLGRLAKAVVDLAGVVEDIANGRVRSGSASKARGAKGVANQVAVRNR